MASENWISVGPTRWQPEIRPEAGDVVVSRLAHSPVAYALTVIPNPYQIACGTYDEALTCAKSFAQKARVDVWIADGEPPWALVARHRAAVWPS